MRKYTFENKKVCLLESYDGSALFITSFIMQILLQFVFQIILITTKVDENFNTTIAGICILTTLNELSMFVTPFIYSKIKGENLFKGVGFNKGISFTQILIVIGIAFSTIMTFAPIANAFVNFIVWTGYNVNNLVTLRMDSWTSYILGMLFMAILPAICEEFLYRGMISRAFGDRGVLSGILLSALFFALMHGNPVQLVHQFFLGIVCATVFLLTRSIWASVIIHFLNNAVALTGNFIMFKTGNLDYVEPIWISIVSFIIGIIALSGLLYVFYLETKKKRGDKNDSSSVFQGMAHQFEYMKYLDSERQVVNYEKSIREKQIEECDSEQMREVLASELKSQKGKIDKKSRNSLIYALIISLALWILNTIMGYIK